MLSTLNKELVFTKWVCYRTRMTHFSNKGREIAQNANDATLKKIRYPIPLFYECYCFSSCQKHTMFIHNKPALSVTVIYLPPVFPQQLLQCQRALRVAAAVVYLIFRIVMNESNGIITLKNEPCHREQNTNR